MHIVHKILVADGDIHLGKFLKRQLGHNNHQVDFKTDGSDAADELGGNAYDLLILELDLPGMDGIDLIRKIRATQPKLPILVLSARNRTEDIVRGLEEGADDYLKKPFSFMVLAARVQVLLSRKNVTPAAVSRTAGELTIDMDGHQAFRGGRRIDLSPREFEILEYMMNNVGKVLSRKTLMEEVWKVAADPNTNIVDVYMKYLRDKIDLNEEAKLIRTVRGVGYVLSDGCERLPPRNVDADPQSEYQATTMIGATCAA
jgi:two-component system copper resistance phosphate regulon response regulator CusR